MLKRLWVTVLALSPTTSVSDPFHFDMDPDEDPGSRSLDPFCEITDPYPDLDPDPALNQT